MAQRSKFALRVCGFALLMLLWFTACTDMPSILKLIAVSALTGCIAGLEYIQGYCDGEARR